MTWVGSGIVKHPRTGAVVTTQPTVRAFRTDTSAIHGTTATAGADGVVTFTDLVDDVEYVAYADISLPTWAVVPLTYQFQIRAVAAGSVPATKIAPGDFSGAGAYRFTNTNSGGEAVGVTPGSGAVQIASSTSSATVAGLLGANLRSGQADALVQLQCFFGAGGVAVATTDGSSASNIGILLFNYARIQIAYQATGIGTTRGAVNVDFLPNTDVLIITAQSSTWNLRHNGSTGQFDLRRVTGSAALLATLMLQWV